MGVAGFPLEGGSLFRLVLSVPYSNYYYSVAVFSAAGVSRGGWRVMLRRGSVLTPELACEVCFYTLLYIYINCIYLVYNSVY